MENKKLFLIRLIAFILLGCVAPILFIGFRFKLFGKVSEFSLSGWGLIGIIIAFLFVIYVSKMIRNAMPYSMITQIIQGLLKVILPLFLLYLLINSLKNSLDAFSQSLLFTIICEFIAIPINPLPKWVGEHKTEQNENLIKKFIENWKGEK